MSLEHFVRIARRGSRGACSGGERCAHLVAESVLDCVPRMDDQAIDGLIEFIRGAKRAPMSARELLETEVARAT